MNIFTKSIKQLIAITLLLVFSNSLMATDGYFSMAFGTKSKGMGGAGIALYSHSLSGATNPAGMHYLGNSYEGSLGLFSPDRAYTISGTATIPTATMFPPPFGMAEGTVTSGNKLFPMPSFAANWMMCEKGSIGVALFGNGGMNSEYDAKTFYAQYLDGPVMPDGSNPMAGVIGPTGVDLMQMFGTLSFSREIVEGWSAGITVIGAWQGFKATGLEAFRNFGMSKFPNALTGNGYDNSYGYGGKIGILGKIYDGFYMGATYQTKINMSKFDKYKGLFAEEGDFDVPATWTVGLAYEMGKFTFAFDVKQILYSGVKSVSNPLNPMALMPMVPNPQTGQMIPNPDYVPLGSELGSGFGWEDVMALKYGVQYAMNEKLDLRAGFSMCNNPVTESEVMFNILAPGVIKNHVTLGFTTRFGNKELDFAIVRALKSEITGPNPLDPAQTITLGMSQWEFEVGFRF